MSETQEPFIIYKDEPLLPQLVFLPHFGEITFRIEGDFVDDADEAKFSEYVNQVYEQELRWKVTVGMNFPVWLKNFCENMRHGLASLPSARYLPKAKKDKALVVGNGPSAEKLKEMDLSSYEIYTCWHASPRVPVTPDYVVHSSRFTPVDLVVQPIPGAVFVGECTTVPSFYQLAAQGGNNVYLHYNAENMFDAMLADLQGEICGPPNQGTVTTLTINTAMTCGHKDITLIGVDLTGNCKLADGRDGVGEMAKPANDIYRVCLERIAASYATVKFYNLSDSQIKGFSNIESPQSQ